ncbi:MAG: cell division protein FtsZ, partial [Chloroflexi bacterium]|nr:cell division protein FtsZ [Chloroflexota bacterium]
AEAAISSSLLDITIDGARGILFNVTGGPSMTLFEVNQAAAIIKETAHPDVNLIFGAVVDPSMGEELRITVIATGFERQSMPRRVTSSRAMQPAAAQTAASRPHTAAPQSAAPHNASPSPAPSQKEKDSAEFAPRVYNTEDLDIPAFLRRR